MYRSSWSISCREELYRKFKKANNVNVELFYLRGGLDFNKLTGIKKKVLQFVKNMMEKENNVENQEMIKLFKDGGNYVSNENLKPMIKYINSNL